MSLIICPECGVHVSNKAKLCPNCGYPNPGGNPEIKEEDVTSNATTQSNDKTEQINEPKADSNQSVSTPQVHEQPKTEDTSYKEPDYKYKYKPRRNSYRTCCWIVIVLILIFILGIVAIVWFSSAAIKKYNSNTIETITTEESEYDPDYFDKPDHNDDDVFLFGDDDEDEDKDDAEDAEESVDDAELQMKHSDGDTHSSISVSKNHINIKVGKVVPPTSTESPTKPSVSHDSKPATHDTEPSVTDEPVIESDFQ